jgi:hypothetical protein
MHDGIYPAPAQQPETDILQREFAPLLAVVEGHARNVFRRLKCPGKRDDAVAEAVALAWRWLRRRRCRGKDASTSPDTLACFATRAVRCGRRLCGQESSEDALSPLAQRRHGFVAESLPVCDGGIEGRVSRLRREFRTDRMTFCDGISAD